MFDIITNAVKKMFTNSVSSTPWFSFQFNSNFAQSSNKISYDLFDCNWDIQSCIETISDNIGVSWELLWDRRRNGVSPSSYYVSLFENYKLFKHEFVKHKALWWEFVIYPVMNKLNSIAYIKIAGKNKYKKIVDQWDIVLFEIKDQYWSKIYKAEEVLYCQFNVSKTSVLDWYGIIDSLIDDIAIDAEARNTTKSFYKNNAHLLTWFKTSGELTPESKSWFMNEIWKLFTWSHNSWKSLITNNLDSITTVSAPQLNVRDDRLFTTDKICSKFKVAKEIISYETKSWNYSKKEIFVNFQRTTMQAWNNIFQESMNSFLNKFESILITKLHIDIVNDSTITVEEEKQINQDYLDGVVTLNEARIKKWLLPIDWWDTFVVITKKLV